MTLTLHSIYQSSATGNCANYCRLTLPYTMDCRLGNRIILPIHFHRFPLHYCIQHTHFHDSQTAVRDSTFLTPTTGSIVKSPLHEPRRLTCVMMTKVTRPSRTIPCVSSPYLLSSKLGIRIHFQVPKTKILACRARKRASRHQRRRFVRNTPSIIGGKGGSCGGLCRSGRCAPRRKRRLDGCLDLIAANNEADKTFPLYNVSKVWDNRIIFIDFIFPRFLLNYFISLTLTTSLCAQPIIKYPLDELRHKVCAC